MIARQQPSKGGFCGVQCHAQEEKNTQAVHVRDPQLKKMQMSGKKTFTKISTIARHNFIDMTYDLITSRKGVRK